MSRPVIYHIDVNSAFLSWEACYRIRELKDNIDLREIPSAIGGSIEKRHGIVLAKSIPAKKYGIRTGEPLVKAFQKCPELVVVPPNFELYVKNSKQFIDILKRFAPVVEQYSIDEAFCDMSGTEGLYGSLTDFAGKLKNQIYDELGFTVNVGISTNKLLAKMASDFKKPNLVHTLFPEEVPQKLWTLPVEELLFVGRSTSKKLHMLGIHTIGELAKADRETLKIHLKKHGEVIWNYANGIDDDSVALTAPANKGYSNSITIPFDVTDTPTAKRILLSLCETVGARIRADRAYIKTIGITLVDHEFNRTSKQTSLSSSTDVTEKLFDTASSLFDTLWDGFPIRLMGVFTSQASSESYDQMNLFDLDKYEKLSRLDSAIDSIRKRFGDNSVQRAVFLEGSEEHMAGGLSKAKQDAKKHKA